MNTDLDFKKFKQEDFPEYLGWFQDSELNKRLGPMQEEDEWLTVVLTEEEGCTYSVFQGHELVSVIGLVYPNKQYPSYCITNIAVKPMLRSRGIGKQVLTKIMTLLPLEKGQYWKAYVDEKNPKATSFFEKNGWRSVSKLPENNDMFIFEYRKE